MADSDLSKAPLVSCPTCKTEVVWHASSHWKPFCSERCKLIDLGEWFDEKHRIADDDPAMPYVDPFD